MVVALNSDASVKRQGKGSDRPVNALADRLAVIAALECVSLVTWFEEDTPIERINESFGLHLDEDDFDTIGGLISHAMGHVPKRGEIHELEGLRFIVLHSKGGAVTWFKVMPTPSGA